jgi:beta-xylosidase
MWWSDPLLGLLVIATPARKGDKGNHLLRKTTSYYYLIQEEDYSECQLSEEVRVSRSRSIRRPDYWS